MSKKYVCEPFRIKMVEPLPILSREERLTNIKIAKYNLFNLHSTDVTIDLLTDSGTNAMSDAQWAGVMIADESYAGAKSYYHLTQNAKDIFGYEFIQPVHQGRAAEKVLLPILLGPKKYAIANTFFDTTRAHVELTGARCIDCIVPEALEISTFAPFKGNMDLEKLEETILTLKPENIGLITMTITNNSCGGQPVSMENMRQTSEIAHRYHIPLMIDAARYAENAYFVQQREPEWKSASIRTIVKTMFSYADVFTMSAKKDAIVNMGGLIGIKNDANLYQKLMVNTISYEGYITYGGMSGRDLEALAIGLKEGLQQEFLEYRIGQVEYLASRLDEANIPYQKPAGGHGVFIDAKALLPHIPANQFPAQALAIELYIEAGIRSCDVGSLLLGNDPDTKEQLVAPFEFTRLAIPRRVYTQSHLDVIVDALIEIKNRRDSIRGYKIVKEAPVLRHFTIELEPIA
ncbi:MAG: tryptophanase [Bacilli bacterium]|nr:tryptophanase [Bacilli bacterium]